MEVVITVDVLRRGGFDVKLAGVNGTYKKFWFFIKNYF
jgi:putative intracellular protease/amidase